MTPPLIMLHENGKTITVNISGGGQSVAFIVWQKNGGVKLPLRLRFLEAKQLRDMLDAALVEAKK